MTIIVCCLVAQSCLTLCNPIDTAHQAPLSFTIHYPPVFAQAHVHWISEAIQPSHPVACFSSCFQSFPVSGSFPMSRLFAPGGQSIGASASASVLPMNIQDWSPLEWTGWISLLSKGLSRVFSSHVPLFKRRIKCSLKNPSNSMELTCTHYLTCTPNYLSKRNEDRKINPGQARYC